jgi:lysyl-tRNA synthetase class 2
MEETRGELSELERIRQEKIERLRAAGIEPYPARSHVTHTAQQALNAFQEAEGRGEEQPLEVTVAGRLRSVREMGKVVFAHIEDGSGRLQLFLRVNELGPESLRVFTQLFDLGDFVEASGTLFRTRTGEITLHVQEYRMLAKSLAPLPAAKDEVVDGQVLRHTVLSDPEARYRQRYADLAVNPDVREVFLRRAAAVRALRQFLDGHDFLEVETPILQPVYGGAAARPFVTYHNQLKQQLFLRISFELYLKRLLVGGFDRVYEIGRDFRNEGVSYKHNPEFTQLEFYQAYSDYLQVMELTEQMLAFVCDQVLGTRQVPYGGEILDFNPPWRRVSLRDAVLEASGIDIDRERTRETLAGAMRSQGLEVKEGASRGKLIDGLVGDLVEPKLIQPTFLYDYPRDISPLAKGKPDDPDTVERFEGFVGGLELCNAFSELNDPLEQERRFLETGRTYGEEDDEHHPMDTDFLRALSYGMPPAGGFGIGVDRLVMLLTDRHSIREVILFPHLREREEG